MSSQQPAITLDSVKDGEYVVVSHRGGRGFIRKLTDLGVYPGARLKVIAPSRGGGPVMLSIKGSSFGIGRGMAARILVKQV